MTTTEVREDLAALSPSEVDEELAALWLARQQIEHGCNSYREMLRRNPNSVQRNEWQRQADELSERRARNVALAGPLEVEYERRPWARFFLVPGGHVHSSMICETCYPTTEYAWLPNLSGRTEGEMVAEWGEVACTICFPSAPTFRGFGDGTSAVARYTAAEKAERQAEKARKAAEKTAKAIDPIRLTYRDSGRHADTVKTIVAAERKLSAAVQDFGWYGARHGNGFAEWAWQLLVALLARGIDADRLRGIVDRAAKKALKDGAEHDLRAAS